jgi:indole-3-glycerol phosphate synthase
MTHDAETDNKSSAMSSRENSVGICVLRPRRRPAFEPVAGLLVCANHHQGVFQMTGTILEKIVETKRAEVAEARRRLPLDVVRSSIDAVHPPRDFLTAITHGQRPIRLIAEIKKRSPSAGLIRDDFDPVVLARIYENAGTAALSVLTDATYFSGDLSFIAAVKQAVHLPVLRKDFLIDDYQIYESRAAGADAILLIAEILMPKQLETYSDVADRLGMAALVEVHDEAQLRRCLPLIAKRRRIILGINNRDLRLQCIDLDTTRRLARELPPGTPFVAESGIASRADVETMQAAGASALLVGETLMRAEDIPAKIRELFGQ